MTADLSAAADKVRAQACPAAKPVQPATAARWVVVRQYGNGPDLPVCTHRFERAAEWCARRKTKHDASNRHGAYFSARRADS